MSNLIGGGRLVRAELRTLKGDNRDLQQQKLNKGALLKRLWRYLGRNRVLLVLAMVLSMVACGGNQAPAETEAVATGDTATYTVSVKTAGGMSMEL